MKFRFFFLVGAFLLMIAGPSIYQETRQAHRYLQGTLSRLPPQEYPPQSPLENSSGKTSFFHLGLAFMDYVCFVIFLMQ